MGNSLTCAACVLKNETGHPIIVKTYHRSDTLNKVAFMTFLIEDGQERTVKSMPDHRGLKVKVEGSGVVLPMGEAVKQDMIVISDLSAGKPIQSKERKAGRSYCMIANETESSILLTTYLPGEMFNQVPFKTFLVEPHKCREVQSRYSMRGVKVKGENSEGVCSRVRRVSNNSTLVVAKEISANKKLGE